MIRLPLTHRLLNICLASSAGLALLGAGAPHVAAQDRDEQEEPIRATPVPPTLAAQQTRIAPGMSAIDVLLIKDAIRENWANYSLLLDGDGTSLHIGEWAELTFTEDMKWVWYDVNGETTGQTDLKFFTDQKPTTVPTPENPHPWMTRMPAPGNIQRSAKHLPISIKFDEITPTTAKTRSMVMMFDVPVATEPNKPDTAPGLSTPSVPQAAIAIYHDEWRLEDGYWLKSASILYSAHCGWFPEPTGDYSCVDRNPPPGDGGAEPREGDGESPQD